MCWIPIKDVPNKNIYPPQAKEYIVYVPDEIVFFVYKEQHERTITRNRDYGK